MNTVSLKSYQGAHAAALLRALEQHGAALDASDTGTGKTYVACHLARHLGVTPLVVCPLSVTESWKRAAKLMGIEVEVVNYEKARGVRKKVLLGKNIYDRETGLPYHGPFIQRLSSSAWGKESKYGNGSYWQWDREYELVIFDEVHRCGGVSSLNSKLLIGAKRVASKVLCLSATAANDPRQMKALGFTLGLFSLKEFQWWLFKHGCSPSTFGGFEFTEDAVLQQEVMAKIGRAIFPEHGSRIRKAEVPGFPQTLVDVRLIHDETAKAMPLMEELKEEWAAGRGLARITEIRQELELLRLEAMADMVEDAMLVSKVMVFLNYTASIDALWSILDKRLKTHIPVIDGRESDRRRRTIVDAFQRNQWPVVLVNSQAGGTGLDMHDPTGQVERTSLISPCYDPKEIKQVLGRPHRDGAAFSRQYFVYFAGTLEEDVATALQRKLTNLDALNEAALHGVFK